MEEKKDISDANKLVKLNITSEENDDVKVNFQNFIVKYKEYNAPFFDQDVLASILKNPNINSVNFFSVGNLCDELMNEIDYAEIPDFDEFFENTGKFIQQRKRNLLGSKKKLDGQDSTEKYQDKKIKTDLQKSKEFPKSEEEEEENNTDKENEVNEVKSIKGIHKFINYKKINIRDIAYYEAGDYDNNHISDNTKENNNLIINNLVNVNQSITSNKKESEKIINEKNNNDLIQNAISKKAKNEIKKLQINKNNLEDMKINNKKENKKEETTIYTSYKAKKIEDKIKNININNSKNKQKIEKNKSKKKNTNEIKESEINKGKNNNQIINEFESIHGRNSIEIEKENENEPKGTIRIKDIYNDFFLKIKAYKGELVNDCKIERAGIWVQTNSLNNLPNKLYNSINNSSQFKCFKKDLNDTWEKYKDEDIIIITIKEEYNPSIVDKISELFYYLTQIKNNKLLIFTKIILISTYDFDDYFSQAKEKIKDLNFLAKYKGDNLCV